MNDNGTTMVADAPVSREAIGIVARSGIAGLPLAVLMIGVFGAILSQRTPASQAIRLRFQNPPEHRRQAEERGIRHPSDRSGFQYGDDVRWGWMDGVGGGIAGGCYVQVSENPRRAHASDAWGEGCASSAAYPAAGVNECASACSAASTAGYACESSGTYHVNPGNTQCFCVCGKQ